MLKYIILPALPLAFSLPVYADETTKPTTPEKCFSAEFYVDALAKTASLKSEKRDIVDTVIVMQMTMQGDAPLPERFTYRTGDVDTELPIQADGTVPTATQIAGMPEGKFCLMDQRIGENGEGKIGVGLGIESDVLYKNTSGTHTLAELVEGAKDGKQHYKKMYGGMVGLVKFNHLLVEYENDSIPAQITATKNGMPIEGLTTDTFSSAYIIKIKDLKKLGADGLSVGGGPYTLSPAPNKKTLEKHFGN